MVRITNLDGSITWVIYSGVASVTSAGSNSVLKLGNGDTFNLVQSADVTADCLARGARLVIGGSSMAVTDWPALTRRA